jgi:poly-gamma-glutamate capsule biosynthesis protein CapA/YwtB (metallophosphatase superfamily)
MKILIRKPPSQEIRDKSIIGYDGNHTTDYKVLFVGDVHAGDNYRYSVSGKNRIEIIEKYGYDYAFEKIKSLLFDSDLVIANLETPLIDIANTPRPSFSSTDDSRYRKKQGRFLHWSDVKRAPAYLKKYNITNVSLANNHMLDYGIDGFIQTLEGLHKHSIRFFGASYDKKQADRPFIETIVGGNRTFKLVVISAFEYRKEYDKHFSFYASSSKGGVNPLSIRRIANNIRRIREVNNNNVYIVAYPHWGGARSYGWKTDAQTTVAHKLIDAGADIVIGHGPHNLQQIEQYKGKWIIYSIGNFVYISPGQYSRFNAPPFSLAVNLIFKEHKNFTINNKDAASDNEIIRYMKIYPIVTDNKLTNYQVRVVNQKEFEIVRQILIEKNYAWEPSERNYKLGVDNIGQFIELSVS